MKAVNDNRKADFDQTKATVLRLTTLQQASSKSLKELRLPKSRIEALKLKAAD